MKKKQKINALEMVRQIRDQQYEQTKSMDEVEKRGYYQQKAQTLISQLQHLIRKWRKKMVTA